MTFVDQSANKAHANAMTSDDFCTVTVLKEPCFWQCIHVVISSRKKRAIGIGFTFVQEKKIKHNVFNSADQKTQSDVPVVTRAR